MRRKSSVWLNYFTVEFPVSQCTGNLVWNSATVGMLHCVAVRNQSGYLQTKLGFLFFLYVNYISIFKIEGEKKQTIQFRQQLRVKFQSFQTGHPFKCVTPLSMVTPLIYQKE